MAANLFTRRVASGFSNLCRRNALYKGHAKWRRPASSSSESAEMEPWMQEEVKRYEEGRQKLAKLMNEDPESFSEAQVTEALQYLLPSRLTAKDARPFLKHPNLVYPKRKDSEVDIDGRPFEPGFFTGSPMYHNLLFELHTKLHDLDDPSTVSSQEDAYSVLYGSITDGSPSPSVNTTPLRWLKKEEMEDFIQESLNDSQYDTLIAKLREIEDHTQGHRCEDFLNQFRRPLTVLAQSSYTPKVIAGHIRTYCTLLVHICSDSNQKGDHNLGQINKKGESFAVGSRKCAAAKVWVKEGEGLVTVNCRDFVDFFPRLEDREQVLYPMVVLGCVGQYDVRAAVSGGGPTGQAGAIRLGLSRALLALSDSYEAPLRKEGLLIRDPRSVERKKPGQKKARKKFTWVKR